MGKRQRGKRREGEGFGVSREFEADRGEQENVLMMRRRGAMS